MSTFTSRSFFYTVNAWERVKSVTGFTNSSKTAEDAGLPEKNYVKFTTDTKAVNTENEVVYRVALWEKVSAGQPDPRNNNVIAPADKVYGPLEWEASGAMIPTEPGAILFDEWRLSIEDSAEVIGVDYLFGTLYAYSRIVDEKFIEWTIVAKKAITTKPKFKVQFNPDSGLNDTPNYQTVPIKAGMKVPTVQFTAGKTDPPVPRNVKQGTFDPPTLISGGSTSWYEWNECTSRWLKYARKNQEYVNRPVIQGGPYHKYDVWIDYFDKNGDPILPSLKLGTEINKNTKVRVSSAPKSKLIPTVNEANSPTKRASDELRKAKACAQQEEVEGDLPAAKPVIPEDANEKVNPPSHFITRGLPLTMRSTGVPYSTNPLDPAFKKATRIKNDIAAGRATLGMMFQDKDTTVALNAAGDKSPYGFRFTYNPTTIQYQTAMNTQIDWLLSSNDPANVIGGNTQVSFTLYLNRISDMTELAPMYEKPGTYSKNYPRPLTEKEIQGILHRGTEYDIEFLYRCVNGTPQPSDNGLLTYKVSNAPAVTSDFGYITGTPIWIKLHNNMRFKGSLASISVNHVMFSLDMIPILSTVDVSFIRYPVFGDIPDKQTDAYREAAKKLKTGDNEPTSGG
jgi:hypothetical protein